MKVTVETGATRSRNDDNQSNKPLNELLRHELAAAAMYEKAAEKVEGDERIALEQNRWSHVVRAVALGQMIREHGGSPSTTAGAWSLASMMVAGSAALSHKLALRAMQEAEHFISDSLESGLAHLPSEERSRVEHDIVPEQRQSESRARRILAAH